jgi:hypothetical protein
MRKLLIAGAIVGGLIVPAAAQTVTEYYVVRNPETKRCTIVTERPTASNDRHRAADGEHDRHRRRSRLQNPHGSRNRIKDHESLHDQLIASDRKKKSPAAMRGFYFMLHRSQKLSVAAPCLISACMALAPITVTPSMKSSCL